MCSRPSSSSSASFYVASVSELEKQREREREKARKGAPPGEEHGRVYGEGCSYRSPNITETFVDCCEAEFGRGNSVSCRHVH